MNNRKIVFTTIILFIIFYLFYLAGIFFPESWWSTHFLFFESLKTKIAIFFISAILPILFVYFSSIAKTPSKSTSFSNEKKIWFLLILSALIGVVQYSFPMVFDYYGEAFKLQRVLTIIPSTIPEGTNEALFSFSLSPWAGQNTILGIITYIAYWTGSTYQNAFYLLDAITGALFSFIWLLFIHSYFKKIGTKLLTGIVGLASPFMLTFFGHIEIYGPIFLSNLLWLILALTYLKRKKSSYLFILGILLIVSLKLHAVALLFIPAYLLLLLKHYKPEIVKKHNLFSWKNAGTYLIFPILLIGAFFYFFIFEDYNDPRQIQYTVKEYDRLFLPLLSPEAPLDNYNMLSWNHIFDYFNEILLWSPGMLFLILISGILFRKKINWNAPAVIISGISLLLFATLFFVVNPLLTMQMDWDLFIMPAPLFLIFGAVIIQQVEDEINKPLIAGSVMGIIVLSLPIFTVHNSESKLAQRLELVGVRIFKTYYEWSQQTLNLAWSHLSENENELEQRRTKIINQLKPYAVPGKDYEYAKLIAQEARIAIREKNIPQEGLKLLKQAEYYFPNLNLIVLYKLEAHFLLKDFREAYKLSEQLIKVSFPSQEKAISIAVHCALEAEMYDIALEKSELYIRNIGETGIIFEVNKRLKANDNVVELKNLFSQSQQ